MPLPGRFSFSGEKSNLSSGIASAASISSFSTTPISRSMADAMVALTMTPTPRPQENFWLPGHKLKPQRETMLLLAAEVGAVSWD